MDSLPDNPKPPFDPDIYINEILITPGEGHINPDGTFIDDEARQMEVQNKLGGISNYAFLKKLDSDQTRRAIQKLVDTYPEEAETVRDYIQNKSKTLKDYGDMFSDLESPQE